MASGQGDGDRRKIKRDYSLSPYKELKGSTSKKLTRSQQYSSAGAHENEEQQEEKVLHFSKREDVIHTKEDLDIPLHTPSYKHRHYPRGNSDALSSSGYGRRRRADDPQEKHERVRRKYPTREDPTQSFQPLYGSWELDDQREAHGDRDAGRRGEFGRGRSKGKHFSIKDRTERDSGRSGRYTRKSDDPRGAHGDRDASRGGQFGSEKDQRGVHTESYSGYRRGGRFGRGGQSGRGRRLGRGGRFSSAEDQLEVYTEGGDGKKHHDNDQTEALGKDINLPHHRSHAEGGHTRSNQMNIDRDPSFYHHQENFQRREFQKGKGIRDSDRSPHQQKRTDKDKSWYDSVRSLSLQNIMSLSRSPPEDLISELFSKIKSLQTTLQYQRTLEKPGIMDAILLILSKICNSLTTNNDDLRYKANQILGEVLSTRCSTFQFHLKMYVQNISKGEQVHRVCKLFHDLLLTLPGSSWSCLPADELENVVKYGTFLMLDKETIQKDVQSLLLLRKTAREEHSRQAQHPKEPAEEWDNSEYKDVQILPKWEEVCTNHAPSRLRKNIISGSYSSWLHYYDIQFRLLREDFLAPLRKGVCDYLSSLRGRKLECIRVYKNVLVKEPVFSASGVCYKIRIDVTRFRRCNWEHSKRLLHGSLLCLSPDHFKNDIYFATVMDRDSEKIADGYLEIMFQDGAKIFSYSCKEVFEFSMIESTAYFEASSHILRSLQTAEVDTMPFTKYLIDGECRSVEVPEYLVENGNPYNLSFILKEEELAAMKRSNTDNPATEPPLEGNPDNSLSTDSDDSISLSLSESKLLKECFLVDNITDFVKWPSVDLTELDSSQMKALQMALTQEIAVIQGPPGTGKTYIGLKVVEALMTNKAIWNSSGTKSPILVMCLTNHALDQFLEGIISNPLYENPSSFNSREKLKLVRIGGRSQSESIAELNLSKWRQKVHLPWEVLDEKREAEKRVLSFEKSVVYKYSRSVHRLIELEELLKYNIIYPQHRSLLFYYVNTEEEEKFALQIWLGIVMVQVLEPDPSAYEPPKEQELIDDTSHTEMAMAERDDEDSQEQRKSEINERGSQAEMNNDVDIQVENPPQDSDSTNSDSTSSDSASDSSESESSDFSSSEEEDSTDSESSEEESEHDGGTLIEVVGEATIEQSERNIDDDQYSQRETIEIATQAENICDNTIFSVGENQSDPGGNPDDNGPKRRTLCFFNPQGRELFEWGNSLEPMSEEDAFNVTDIHYLSQENRWRLYKYWHLQYLNALGEECEEKFEEYDVLCKQQDEARKKADRYALEAADIIGMTTTGAAKYQHILHLVKPRIVIVEEAAEVLESHIVSALNAGTQHLILIGDHKQLRPKPNEYELAKKYKLDISLFERLLLNQFPHVTLEIQHRMRPEISQLVKPHIYQTLYNHSSVEKYPDVRGVSTNLFFIQHEFPEREDENLMSHSNSHEAEYLVQLCLYLLRQNYTPEQITILVTYSGQLLAMRRLMPKKDFAGVKIKTVDNFQGEENDIILLSLVRSNESKKVGFLREENRMCVALSRAREGFYCIGNFKMLREEVRLWEAIISDMENKGKLGDGLLLHCSNHHDVNFIAKTAKDFIKKSPNGGCLKDCTYRLPCGHVCAQKCHYTDPNHENYECLKPCARKCPEGHSCPKRCNIECKCVERVTRSMPDCNHDQIMFCHQKPSEVRCVNPCKNKCPKGHDCPLQCYEVCRSCIVVLTVQMPSCNHEQQIRCHENPNSIKCAAPCSHKCENGHLCPKRCYEECGNCTYKIMKAIPECNHKVSLACHVKPEHSKCTEPCEKILPCNHQCSLKCGEICSSRKCMKPVTIELAGCGHNKRVLCYQCESPSLLKCDEKCTKNLPCGHNCGLKCSEPCKTKCNVIVNKTWPCGHKLKRPCYQVSTPEEFPCNKNCEKELECGHTCPDICGKPCVKKCTVNVNKKYPCGHLMVVPCHSNPSEHPCTYKCAHILACGHRCSGKCSQCSSKHIHKLCPFEISIDRFCGHQITLPCIGLSDTHPGRKTFLIRCSHLTIQKECPIEDYHTCDKPCDWICPHFACSRTCSEMCDRPRCDVRCDQKLKCGHRCYGVCSEPCLSSCPICKLKNFNKKLKFVDSFSQEMLYYQLPCEHIFTVEFLDKYVEKKVQPNPDIPVGPLLCPVVGCSASFSCSYRYGNQMKLSLSYMQDVNVILKDVPGNFKLPEERDIESLFEYINEIVDSDDFEEIGHTEYKLRKKQNRKEMYYGWNDSFVRYKPMPAIASSLCELQSSQIATLSSEDKFLILIFIETLKFLEIINSSQLSDYFDSENVVTKDVTLLKIKKFLKFLSVLINARQIQFKLTYQLISDIQSEYFRLYLTMQCLIIRCVYNPVEDEYPALAKTESFLKDSLNNVTKSEFLHQMEAMVEHALHTQEGLKHYAEIMSDIEIFTPIILKGRWWRCVRGHYYCSPPSVLRSIHIECPKCKGE